MESDLSGVAPATLLKLLSVMDNFLEVFQEFNKNSFQYKKHLLVVVFQAYKWCRYVYGGSVASLFLWLYEKFSFSKIPKENCLAPEGSK